MRRSAWVFGRELDEVLQQRYASQADVADFHSQLVAIADRSVA